MTREEAIKMLKSKMDGNTDTSYEWAETVRMAIKALEQQPITTTNNDEPITVIYPTIVCDDAVSREAVYQLLMDKASSAYGFGEIRRIVDELPSVTQKYGKWIHIGGDEWVCSECGEVITTEGSWDKPKDKYCKECGAKLQESEDKE